MNLSQLGADEKSLYVRVAAITRRTTRGGAPFLTLKLADRSAALPGTIFNDHEHFELASSLKAGQVIAIRARRGNYQGRPELELYKLRLLDERDDDRWDPDQVYGPELARVRDLCVQRIVIDIETAPLTDVRSMPPTLVEEVTRVATDREWPIEKVLALNPLFSRVVSIAIGNADTEDGSVLLAPREDDLAALSDDAPPWLRPLAEPDLIGAFWALAGAAELVVTFNGRNFDLPFLRTRSAILGVPVVADLVSQPPFQHAPHLDLYQVLTGGSHGARPMNLDAACFAFGIDSPKHEMDGSMIGQAYAEGRYREIADYNLADTRATRELYRRLKTTIVDFLG